MVFSSLIFICVFLPITILAYFLVPKKLKNYALLSASLIFYAWGEPVYILLFIFSIIMNYLFGLLVAPDSRGMTRKAGMVIAVIFNLGLLGFFKYISFIFEGINGILGFIGISPIPGITGIMLPLGISFYTFQALSYVIDVYLKKTDVQKNPFYVALYISLFPQLVAGPIVRYIDIAKEINTRQITVDGFFQGLIRFCIGVAKKVLIANNVAVIADMVFSQNPGCLSGLGAWTGIIAYTLQIFFDFSGYSDMAIGMGKMFGFHFLENFNYPYVSRSIKDFWRRWHISLSTWFKDYLYIPLGGNRKGVKRTYLNLLIVFFLCGLWHGASVTFIVWGVFHGLFLILERTKFGNALNKAPAFLSHIYTLLVVMIGWVFFRSTTIGYSMNYIGAMFGMGDGSFNIFANLPILKTLIVLAAGIIFSTPIFKNYRLQNTLQKENKFSCLLEVAGSCLALGVFVLSLVFLANDSYNPFIYFRF